jgi:hypothetical protein
VSAYQNDLYQDDRTWLRNNNILQDIYIALLSQDYNECNLASEKN